MYTVRLEIDLTDREQAERTLKALRAYAYSVGMPDFWNWEEQPQTRSGIIMKDCTLKLTNEEPND